MKVVNEGIQNVGDQDDVGRLTFQQDFVAARDDPAFGKGRRKLAYIFVFNPQKIDQRNIFKGNAFFRQ